MISRVSKELRVAINEFIDTLRPAARWDEVCKLVNEKFDLEYGESAYRKPYQNWKAMPPEDVDKRIERYAKAEQRLELERKIFNQKRRINNQQLNKLAQYHLFNEELLSSIERLPEPPTFTIDETTKRHYMINMSDLHYDGRFNIYEHFDKVIQLILNAKNEYGFDRIVVVEEGDTFEGAGLRVNQLKVIRDGIVDQTMKSARGYAYFLTVLASHLPIDFYCVNSSNHTQLRLHGTGRDEQPDEDMMRVFVELIDLMLPKGIKRTFDKEIFVNLFGFDFHFHHGHAIKSKERHMENVASSRKQNIDFDMFGHYHHHRVIDLHKIKEEHRMYDKKVIYIPKMCPYDSDHDKQHPTSSHAAILLSCFDETEGHLWSRKLYI